MKTAQVPCFVSTVSCWVICFFVAVFSNLAAETASDSSSPQAGLVQAGFIFEQAPFPASHASTIVETKRGLLAAWFGGARERHPDVGIKTARYDGKDWAPPVQVANGVQDDGDTRYPCWNPVRFRRGNGP